MGAACARAIARERASGKAAQASSTRLAVAEATPLALLFYSDTGRIVYANAGARELFFEGYSPRARISSS